MRAMQEKPSRTHRRQTFQTELDPVLVRQCFAVHLPAANARKQFSTGRRIVESLDGGVLFERIFADQHRLRAGRRQFESRCDIRRRLLRHSHGSFPEWRRTHARVTKLSMTRFDPALSKSIKSLLPSTATIRP